MEVYEFPSTPMGNDTEAGLLRTADKEDERNCQCEDAAVTPENLYNLNNYRKANTAYAIDDVVAVPYHVDLVLRCTTAGTTGTDSLDVASIYVDKVIQDGTVVWTAIYNPCGRANYAEAVAVENISNKKIMTPLTVDQAINKKAIRTPIAIPENANLNDYGSAGFYYAQMTSTAGTILNVPKWKRTGAFALIVTKSAYTQQLLWLYDQPTEIYARGQLGPGKWSEWANIVDATPVGTILPFTGKIIPDNYMAANGGEINRTTYDILFGVIGTDYGEGDGSTTFNLPNFEDNTFMEFSDTVGIAKEAGLPDIQGNITNGLLLRNNNSSEINSYGTFSGTTNGTGATARGTNITVNMLNEIKFSAKNSNAIYGNADTVQPKSLTVRAIIKYR